MKTSWKPVPGYIGTYEVSSDGQVKSLARTVPVGNGAMRHQQERILSQHLIGPGTKYYKVALCKNGDRKLVNVHKLVALVFIPNPDEKKCVLHSDGNSENNDVSNLRWGTHTENMADMAKHGSRKRTRGPLRLSDTIAIKASKLTNDALAAIYNCHPTTISTHRNKAI